MSDIDGDVLASEADACDLVDTDLPDEVEDIEGNTLDTKSTMGPNSGKLMVTAVRAEGYGLTVTDRESREDNQLVPASVLEDRSPVTYGSATSDSAATTNDVYFYAQSSGDSDDGATSSNVYDDDGGSLTSKYYRPFEQVADNNTNAHTYKTEESNYADGSCWQLDPDCSIGYYGYSFTLGFVKIYDWDNDSKIFSSSNGSTHTFNCCIAHVYDVITFDTPTITVSSGVAHFSATIKSIEGSVSDDETAILGMDVIPTYMNNIYIKLVGQTFTGTFELNDSGSVVDANNTYITFDGTVYAVEHDAFTEGTMQVQLTLGSTMRGGLANLIKAAINDA